MDVLMYWWTGSTVHSLCIRWLTYAPCVRMPAGDSPTRTMSCPKYNRTLYRRRYGNGSRPHSPASWLPPDAKRTRNQSSGPWRTRYVPASLWTACTGEKRHTHTHILDQHQHSKSIQLRAPIILQWNRKNFAKFLNNILLKNLAQKVLIQWQFFLSSTTDKLYM